MSPDLARAVRRRLPHRRLAWPGALRWPADTLGRLRWALAMWAAVTAVASVTAAAPGRHLTGVAAVGVPLAGLVLAGCHVLAFRRGSYAGWPEVVEGTVLALLAGAAGGVASVGALFTGVMARGAFDRVRRVATALALFAGCCVAGAIVDARHGEQVIAADIAGQVSGLVMLGGMAYALAGALAHRQALERDLAHQASHDGLTGLPNRTLILDRADQLLAAAQRTGQPVAALFVDLDGFKDVNDTLGHPVGDRLLAVVAARLSAALRGQDSFGRLGGDEFVVLAGNLPADGGAAVIAQRVLDTLREPFDVDGHLLRVGASIGIATGSTGTGAQLLRDADIALYRAKAAGKARWMAFHPEMHEELQARRRLADELRVALRAGQFFLVYQPQYELRGMTVTGLEALLRWRHPTRGVLESAEFVGALERSNAIVEVGEWVLAQACRQAAGWQLDGRPMPVAVNVSERQLHSARFVPAVLAALAGADLPAAALTLELTERCLLRDSPRLAEQLRALKSIGVRIAVDDFGTGYNTVTQLRRMPIDVLKVDRSFVAEAASAEGQALVALLLDLGRKLGVETVAEGIEDGAALALVAQHCDTGQGFLLSRPLDPAAVETLLRIDPAA